MRKNLITLVILILVVINLVLTAILTFTIVPETKKANELITKVCDAIDLDLQANEVDETKKLSIDEIATMDLTDDITINLKDNGDGKQHYAVLKITISMDTTNEDYKTYGETMSDKESLIRNEINTIVSSYTIDEVQADQQKIQNEILKGLQELFDSKFIIAVGFSSATYQ